MSKTHPYYLVWAGSLNLGDTPGVFTDAHFAGLLLQMPLTITSLPEPGNPIEILLTTTEVEIFNNKKHAIYWDWNPGNPLPTPIGFIDDSDIIPNRPEFHLLTIPHTNASEGKHWMTIQVNAEVPVGLRDDFVLRRIEVHESIGIKIGW